MEHFSGFDWDAGNESKCTKHGVTIAEVETVLSQPLAVGEDVAHSRSEARHKAVGLTDAGRYVFAVYTIRVHHGQRLIRPISARYMHRKEIQRYEETSD